MKIIKTQISADKSEFLIESLETLPGAIKRKDFAVGFLLDNGNFLQFEISDLSGDGKLIIKLMDKTNS